jgi:hypothetical protein
MKRLIHILKPEFLNSLRAYPKKSPDLQKVLCFWTFSDF